jgi:hypothetical protein
MKQFPRYHQGALLHSSRERKKKSSEVWSKEKTIDYRCEDGRSPVSVSFVTISNPNSLSRCKTLPILE